MRERYVNSDDVFWTKFDHFHFETFSTICIYYICTCLGIKLPYQPIT